MRSRFVAVFTVAIALVAVAAVGLADTIVVTNGPYQVSFTDPIPVQGVGVGAGSEGLVATTLKISNISGSDANNPFTFNGSAANNGGIGINGMLHHEQFQLPFPPFTQTATATLLTSGGSSVDSHFVRPAALTITAESEPLVNNATSTEPGAFAGLTGYGGPLRANIGLGSGGDPPPPVIDIAYLVFKQSVFDGVGIDFDFTVASATGGDGAFRLMGLIGAPDDGVAPDVEDFLHPQMDGSGAGNPMPIMHTFTQVDGTDPITWDGFMLDSYTPAYGGAGTGPLLGADFDPLTQKFTWNPVGSPRGDYVWKVTASNSAGEDTGFLTVQIKNVPEPTTLGLIGLGLIGLVGVARRRS